MVSNDLSVLLILAVSKVELSILDVFAFDEASLGHVDESVRHLQFCELDFVVDVPISFSAVLQSQTFAWVRAQLMKILVLCHNIVSLAVEFELKHLMVIDAPQVRMVRIACHSNLRVLHRIQSVLLVQEELVVIATMSVIA